MEKKNGIKIYFELLKSEYEREIERNEKLDVKIGIVLALCSAIFVYFMENVITICSQINLCKYYFFCLQFFKNLIILLLIILCIFFLSMCLKNLLDALYTKPLQVLDFNTDDLPLIYEKEDILLEQFIVYLLKSITQISVCNSQRTKLYDNAIDCMKYSLLLLGIVQILKIFY